MKVISTSIPEVKVIEPEVFGDERGFFFESFNHEKFVQSIGYNIDFVQDNHSRSIKNTLRGLHYQLPPHPQGKLVRVSLGEVFDVAVDIRKNSPTFGHWVGKTISAENKLQLWIPPGFAHGFYVTSDVAEFQYKCTDFYSPACEASIRWDDPDLSINWENSIQPLISSKDANSTSFKNAEVFD